MLNQLFITLVILSNRAAWSASEKDRLRENSTVCKLPAYPSHGTYVAQGQPNAVPGSVHNSIFLNVTCDPGYLAEDSTSIFCFQGIWSNSIPKCIRYCELEPNPSVIYYCMVNDNTGNTLTTKECGTLVPSGTVVRPECRKPNYYHAGTHSFMHCIDGVWDYVASCELECGVLTPQGDELISNARNAARAELPWHVGVYSKSKTSYKYLCGGSIVSTTAVVSVGHCFWNNLKMAKNPASEFAVAAGKLYWEWDNHLDDGFVQKRFVQSLIIPPRFQGPSANLQDDIAVVIVDVPFEIKPYVRPVCLDFDLNFNRQQLRSGNLGKIAGWGLMENDQMSPTLRTVDMPYLSVDVCLSLLPPPFRKSITSDKICAGYTNGTAACNGDSGAGIAFPVTDRGIERFYLRGVLSVAPSVEYRCDFNSVAGYTEIVKHQDFIQESLIHSKWQCGDKTTIHAGLKCNGVTDCPDGSDEASDLCNTTETNIIQSTPRNCFIPTNPEHGTFTMDQRKNEKDKVVVIFRLTCDPGYSLLWHSSVECSNGEWSSGIPQCVRACILKPSPSVEYRCTNSTSGGERSAPCEETQPADAVVKPVCREPFYYSSQPLRLMRCIDGVWDYIPTCRQECGSISSGNERTSVVPYNVARGELPWHATIYTKKTTPYAVICGGTIVSPTSVISAAHCFWSDIQKLLPSSDYAVAVGKLYRQWNSKNDVDVQKRDVIRIKIPDRFYGAATNYQDDIAVVVLAEPIVYTAYVHPACLDFDVNFNRRQLKDKNLGKVGGFGLSNGGTNIPAPILKSVNLPFIEIVQCIQSSPRQFREYITSDKICAGQSNGTSVCKGDGGGGLLFPELEKQTKRYYLRGVLSTAPIPDNSDGVRFCYSFPILSFTELIKHENFIRENLEVDVPKYKNDDNGQSNGEGSSGRCKDVEQFRCTSGECIDAASICDGASDCEDGSDETEDVCSDVDNRERRPTQDTTTTTKKPTTTIVTPISNEISTTAKCILPQQPDNGVYHVVGGKVVNGEATFVLLQYSCYKRFAMLEDPKVFCSDGIWSGERLPVCLQTCYLERHESMNYNCIIDGTESTRPCRDFEVEGTVIQPSCKEPNYYTPLELPYMVCRRGEWSVWPTCVPECGTLTPKGAPLVLGGETAKFGDVPWHAGIYHKNFENGTHGQICGGSLISNSVVLSAAHCFWDEIEKKLFSVKKYAVAVGKLHRDWDHPDDEPFAQKSDVAKIIISKFYQGRDLFYRDDIAVVIVSGPFQYQTYVRPVCLDFRQDFAKSQLQSGVVGKAAGWGLTTGLKGSESRELKVADMPYVSYTDCVRQTSTSFMQYITYDKICAGDLEGLVLCRGDSGGGLAFPETVFNTVRYYIRGIASTTPPSTDERLCNTHSLTGFTSISMYQNLIKTYWLT